MILEPFKNRDWPYKKARDALNNVSYTFFCNLRKQELFRDKNDGI